jgi:hypothetical protein
MKWVTSLHWEEKLSEELLWAKSEDTLYASDDAVTTIRLSLSLYVFSAFVLKWTIPCLIIPFLPWNRVSVSFQVKQRERKTHTHQEIVRETSHLIRDSLCCSSFITVVSSSLSRQYVQLREYVNEWRKCCWRIYCSNDCGHFVVIE